MKATFLMVASSLRPCTRGGFFAQGLLLAATKAPRRHGLGREGGLRRTLRTAAAPRKAAGESPLLGETTAVGLPKKTKKVLTTEALAGRLVPRTARGLSTAAARRVEREGVRGVPSSSSSSSSSLSLSPAGVDKARATKDKAAGSDEALRTFGDLRGVIGDGALVENMERQFGAGASMTLVQHKTFDLLVEGRDVVAKAQTGTGKTVAFLLPTIARCLRGGGPTTKAVAAAAKGGTTKGRRSAPAILVLSPTRELAQQIATQAAALTVGTGLKVGCVVGGLSKPKDVAMLERGCSILVATPGRLCDLLEDRVLGGQLLGSVRTLVLDEGDRLLDAGFAREVGRIVATAPVGRQSVCFSATIPPNLQDMLKSGAVSRDHARVDCGSATRDETAARITLKARALPKGADAMDVLFASLAAHATAAGGASKAIVFCQTTSQVELVSAYLTNRGGLGAVVALHSRKSQSQRTRISERFRDAQPEDRVVLVATDVAARGVDYPKVSLVVQLGAPANREQFVHRTGRTGRAEASGEALLLLEAWEAPLGRALLADVPGLEVIDDHPLPPGTDPAASRRAVQAIDLAVKTRTYSSFLGHTSSIKGAYRTKQGLVDLANDLARNTLLIDPPSISPKAAAMMGLKGLVAVEAPQKRSPSQGGGGGGRRGGPPGGQPSPSGGKRPNKKKRP